jgi:hypothetical protein
VSVVSIRSLTAHFTGNEQISRKGLRCIGAELLLAVPRAERNAKSPDCTARIEWRRKGC